MVTWFTSWLGQLGAAAAALTGGITAGVGLLTAAGTLVSGTPEERRGRALAASALLGLLACGLLVVALLSRPRVTPVSAAAPGVGGEGC